MKYLYLMLIIRMIVMAFVKATKEETKAIDNMSDIKDPAAFQLR